MTAVDRIIVLVLFVVAIGTPAWVWTWLFTEALPKETATPKRCVYDTHTFGQD